MVTNRKGINESLNGNALVCLVGEGQFKIDI